VSVCHICGEIEVDDELWLCDVCERLVCDDCCCLEKDEDGCRVVVCDDCDIERGN
jgi:hypothetical protein